MNVAVIIPAFDAERYLGEALDSVLAQTTPASEIIVVDDGSRDGTADVAATYAERGVRFVAQSNLGPGAARNRGVALTSAPLIAFLDADDLWPVDRLERLVAALAPTAEGITGQVECFASPDMADVDRARLLVPSGPQPSWLPGALVLRRSAWERVGAFDEALKSGGEYIDWVARSRSLGVVIVQHEALALRRRIHAASMTVRAREALGASYFDVVRAARARRG